MTIKSIERATQERLMNTARQHGAKEGEINNPYRHLKVAIKARGLK